MSSHLHVLILAAGESRRMGSPKQLVSIAGKPALAHVVGNASAVAGASVSVVLGSHASEITPLLQRSSVSIVINRNWPEGMASSIRCGVNALPPGCEAVLILLGDQVAVSAADLRRLIGAWNGQDSTLAASVYAGQLGVPAIFPSMLFSELVQLRGDQGAKLILQRHAHRVSHVPMPNAGLDLDQPEDIAPAALAVKEQNKDLML